jgi:hypothetical protein
MHAACMTREPNDGREHTAGAGGRLASRAREAGPPEAVKQEKTGERKKIRHRHRHWHRPCKNPAQLGPVQSRQSSTKQLTACVIDRRQAHGGSSPVRIFTEQWREQAQRRAFHGRF